MLQIGATILAGLAAGLAGAALWRIEVLASRSRAEPVPATRDAAAVLARLDAVEQQITALAAKPVPGIDVQQLATQLGERLQRSADGADRSRMPLPEPAALAASIAQEQDLDAAAQTRLAAVLAEQRAVLDGLRERFHRGEVDDPRQVFEQLRQDTATKLAAFLPAAQVESVLERLRPSRRGGEGGPRGRDGGPRRESGAEAPTPSPAGAAQF